MPRSNASTNANPVFLDFEASSLDGVPIEVGWAFFDGTAVQSEAHLILPDPTWEIERSWDPEAEKVHGISLAQLRESGSPAFNVARRMNEALAGRDVYADSPFDIAWMDQLFAVTEFEPAFHFRRTLAPVLIEQLRVNLGLSELKFKRITQSVREQYPHTHRAEADARQWAELWRALMIREGG